MPTYSYYDDAVSGAELPFEARRHNVVLKKRMKASDIIATNAVMVAAAKIAAGDTIEAIRLPADFIVMQGAIKMVTAEGGTATLDVGVGGGDELFDGANINSAAGTIILTLLGDDWGSATLYGYDLEAADTLDCTYVNDTDAADFYLYVRGWMLW